MSLATDLDVFIRRTNQSVFIEAEGKPNVITSFINDYNSKYSENIDARTDGIIQLQPNADKRGLELRLYFHDKTGVPAGITVTRTDAYRGNYSYRINSVSIIKELFSLGYRIGLN